MKRRYEPVFVEIIPFTADVVLTESNMDWNEKDPGIITPVDPFTP